MQSILHVLEESYKTKRLGFAEIGFSEGNKSIGGRIKRIMYSNYKFYRPLTIQSILALIIISVITIFIACDLTEEKASGDKAAMNITITENGDFEVRGVHAISSDLKVVLKKEIEEGFNGHVIIQVNNEDIYKHVRYVMDTMKNLGVENMILSISNKK